MPDDYTLYVNDERTVMLTYWPTGRLERAERLTPSHTWGPPRGMTGFTAPEAAAVAKWYGCKREAP